MFETYESKKIIEMKKMCIAVAGPLVNIVIACLVNLININIEMKELIMYVNILIAIFNLLPIYPLDGGRILKSILHIKLQDQIADKTF